MMVITHPDGFFPFGFFYFEIFVVESHANSE